MTEETFSLDESTVNLVSAMDETVEALTPDTPFRILLLGDWSGRESHSSVESAAPRRPVLVDRDNFDEVMQKLNVCATLDGASGIELRFAKLDDFHPDRIFEIVPAFEQLRDVRRRLLNERTFETAADEVRGWMSQQSMSSSGEEAESQHAASAPPADGASLLAQMLGESSEDRPQIARQIASGLSDIDALVREVVRPHAVARQDPQQAELIVAVDRASEDLMRTVLHNERVHTLEAAWRALRFLVSRLETNNNLKLYLLDCSKEQLRNELATEDLRQTSFYKLLVEETSEILGGVAWSLLAGNYVFDATRTDAELLASIGSIAQEARTPFVAAASSRLLGCDSLVAMPDPEDWQGLVDDEARRTWNALRSLLEARYLGLVLPGFLLRLPYGQQTERVEQFDFEEIGESQTHEAFLWGNGAFAVVYLIGQTFNECGWNFASGTLHDIEDLPLHVTEEGGETITLPCAEVLLTVCAAEKILDAGLMPLLSFRDQDRVRLARLQSVADPPTSLAGRWN